MWFIYEKLGDKSKKHKLIYGLKIFISEPNEIHISSAL